MSRLAQLTHALLFTFCCLSGSHYANDPKPESKEDPSEGSYLYSDVKKSKSSIRPESLGRRRR